MICKKCETKCDLRAGKALRWLKFFFVSLVASVAIAWIACLFIDPELRRGFVDFCARCLVAAIAFPFYLPFIIPPLFAIVSLCIAIFNCSKWLIHAEKELNRVSEAKLVPWEDVSSALILPLFPFTHFFIFKELLSRQKETLDKNNLESETPPRWALPGILGGGIAIYASFFLILSNKSPAISHISIGCFIAFVILLFASYIKIIRTITANTSALYSLPDAVFTADSPTGIPDTAPTDAPDDTAASAEPDNGAQEQNSDDDRAEASIICQNCARKTIFWFMVCCTLFLVNIILNNTLLTLALIFLMFGAPELLLLAVLPFLIALYKFCRWLLCIEKELNRFRSEPVPPWGTLISALIPFIFPLGHFCIFREQLLLQREALEKNNLEFQDIPKWGLFAILVFGFLMQVCLYFYLGETIAAKIVTFVVSIVLLVSYIKVIRTITANTSALLCPPTDAPSDTPSENS
jgi:energy-converting hydrogenase Eha subunit C